MATHGVKAQVESAADLLAQRASSPRSTSVPDSECQQELWLLGQPPLGRYIEFVEQAAGGARTDRAALMEEWRAANDYYQELERSEAGIANSGSHRELDASFASMISEVTAHPHYRRAFDTLPTTFMLVELDKLIVFQRHVRRTFVAELMRRVGPVPTPEALFRFCMPLEPSAPASVRICELGSHRYVFRCESVDLRYHESTVLRPEQVRDYHSFGAIAGIVGVVVGFGCDFLNGIRVGNRILLHNGYHRACALRSLGMTHAPCIVQTATRSDEIQAVVKGRVAEQPEFYFESARPPLLKDFFDPRLRKVLPLRRQMHLVEVTLEIRHLVESSLTPD
ncbi:hypothetical protein ACFPN2_29280 [Steroidobacter flavus]|uniref:Uncharacterized protein n=1 Tax=Steroidobacter flavus TaxID=1842136 RepID=A0ABV8T0K0_9GAMM